VKTLIRLDRQTVYALHERLLAEYGGLPGVREKDLLRVLGKSRQVFTNPGHNLPQLAAAYVAGIVRNHPFIDGNKRTGFMAGYVFLERNGLHFHASEAETAQAVLELAAGAMEEAGFAAFLRDHVKRKR
jgi:death-on-curing protein